MNRIEINKAGGAAVAAFLATTVLALTVTGCGGGVQPASGDFKVSFPDAETVQFEAILSQTSNFSLDGEIQLPPYGEVYFTPATARKGFTFGGKINLAAFLPSNWSTIPVTRLPTGAFFPPWITTGVIEFPVRKNFNAYLGVSGEKYLGISYAFINSNDFPIAIGGSYYDDKGNVVMGGLIYPAQLNSTGNVVVPGGVFIGTNLSQFMPGTATASGVHSLSVEMLNKLANGEPVTLNGKIVSGEVITQGPGSNKLSPYEKAKLLKRYLKALKEARTL